mmetsp:Transcript_11515/g.46375  ORF Transcript_11515/g.46375 Transcript_11515/m.46375 type:complete len:221 (+) Transcript_11515:307-969(+)
MAVAADGEQKSRALRDARPERHRLAHPLRRQSHEDGGLVHGDGQGVHRDDEAGGGDAVAGLLRGGGRASAVGARERRRPGGGRQGHGRGHQADTPDVQRDQGEGRTVVQGGAQGRDRGAQGARVHHQQLRGVEGQRRLAAGALSRGLQQGHVRSHAGARPGTKPGHRRASHRAETGEHRGTRRGGRVDGGVAVRGVRAAGGGVRRCGEREMRCTCKTNQK